MSDPWQEIEDYARGKRETAASDQRHSDTDAKLDALNEKIDTLAEAVSNIAQSPAGGSPPAPEQEGPPTEPGESSGAAPPPQMAATESEPDLPVERVTRMDVPRIYMGDDEPAQVEYIDGETGETRIRPGRSKGKPSIWHVEEYEQVNTPDEPQEGIL